ncbi:MAG: glycoside hydrolase family 99-like domain-containing protein, partial [Tannerellaceae bacterium]|nr:glycoside hydrolase family 99-like domain-containing protein [Tannerellaceae bacterium]
MRKKARVIAYYLPQFHPIAENDRWWGEGFTEWVNVKKAKPLFEGHYQPRIPADLGYYDLLNPDVREKQAALAREAGIEGFCYWHYWFGNGKRLLERPFQEVLETGKPDFPFCLGWANHSWTNKTWKTTGSLVESGILMEQTYSEDDYIRHFHAVLPAFKDERYIQVDGKPLFLIFAPYHIPDARLFISKWNELAKENGLSGIHFVANSECMMRLFRRVAFRLSSNKKRFNPFFRMGFDAVIIPRRAFRVWHMLWYGLTELLGINVVLKCDYGKATEDILVDECAQENIYPVVLPNWDRTPRMGKRADIWHG